MPPTRGSAPLIVTAQLDDMAFVELDALRRRCFPAALNRVPAHISLFHHLPGEELASVTATLREACAASRRITLQALPPRFLGRGVALAYAAPELSGLHGDLAKRWSHWLTPQDRQPFKAHVTIQNKVDPAAARRLFEAMATVPAPACAVVGVSLWRYLGGPWEAVETILFRS